MIEKKIFAILQNKIHNIGDMHSHSLIFAIVYFIITPSIDFIDLKPNQNKLTQKVDKPIFVRLNKLKSFVRHIFAKRFAVNSKCLIISQLNLQANNQNSFGDSTVKLNSLKI